MNTNVTPAISNSLYSAGNARHLSGALMVSIAPIVHHDLFQEWDDFVTDPLNNYWMYVHYNLLSLLNQSIPFHSIVYLGSSIQLYFQMQMDCTHSHGPPFSLFSKRNPAIHDTTTTIIQNNTQYVT